MVTLILDTSTERALLALAKGSEIIFKEALPFGLRSSHFFFQALQRGLKQTDFSFHDLSRIGVSVGPGSFTGIRVAVSFAKGICLARKIPLLGFCSLIGFVPDFPGRVMALIDAKMGGAYGAIYEKRKEELTVVAPPRLMPLKEINSIASSCDVLVAPVKEKLETAIAHPRWIESPPNAEALIAHLSSRFDLGEAESAQELKLSYLREMSY